MINPGEAAAGLGSDIIPVEEVRVGTLPADEGAILHLVTTDNLPIAVGLSPPVLWSGWPAVRQPIQNISFLRQGSDRRIDAIQVGVTLATGKACGSPLELAPPRRKTSGDSALPDHHRTTGATGSRG